MLTKKNEGLEINKNKDLARGCIEKEILNLGERYAKGFSLCGKHCFLENSLAKKSKASNIVCVESDEKVFKVAKRKLSKKHKIILGDWFDVGRSLHDNGKNISWVWADFCSQPNGFNVSGFCHQVGMLNPKMFAVTFSLNCRQGTTESVSSHFARTFRNERKSEKMKSGSNGFGQLIVRVISETVGFYPKKIIRYNGGGSKNREGKSQMITVIYVRDKKYSFNHQKYNFLGQQMRCYAVTEFMEIKKGEVVKSVVKKEKDPVWVERGIRASITRKRNLEKQKKKQKL